MASVSGWRARSSATSWRLGAPHFALCRVVLFVIACTVCVVGGSDNAHEDVGVRPALHITYRFVSLSASMSAVRRSDGG